MAIPLVLPIIGYSVLSVLVSYVAVRLYRARGSYSNLLPKHVSSFGKTVSWDWRKSPLWSRLFSKRKAKPSKNITVDLLPITGLPPPPTAIPTTPPLVDLSVPRAPSPAPPVSFYQHINKQIHSLHPTSFSRPPSPHALLATTSPPKLPRRSRSLGGVPVRRLSGGASGLRNVQIPDMEMQEMNRDTSREHLLIDFSSSGSSDEPDALRKENEQGLTSRRISPVSSDIGVLPFHRRPSLFDDVEVPLVSLDLAPGRKVVQLVDLGDVEDGKRNEDDAWKWFAPPPPPRKIHFPLLESTPASMAKPISKSISEPLPFTPSMSEDKLIDFHSGTEQEHVLVDLDVQDDNNVPQPEFIDRTRLDLDVALTKTTVDVKTLNEALTARPAFEGRRSLDSLIKPNTTTPDSIPVEIQSLISSVTDSSPRGRMVDRHPLEEVHEGEVKEVPREVEVGPAVTTGTAVEIEDEEDHHQELADQHENHEVYDHHDDHSYAYDTHQDYHSPQSLNAIRGEELQSLSSSSPQVATIPVHATPVWYWDHENDPWIGAVILVNDEDVKMGESGIEELEEDERGVDLVDVSEMEEVGEVEYTVKTSPGSKVLELPVERSLEGAPIETAVEESYYERGLDLMDVSEMEEVGGVEDTVKTSPSSKAIELPVERSLEAVSMEPVVEKSYSEGGADLIDFSAVELSLEDVPIETDDEDSYPDPDYLPLPELSSPAAAASETLLILVENGPSNDFQEDEYADKNRNDKGEDIEPHRQFKDDETSPRRIAAQMPTPPASPPLTSPSRVKGLGVTIGRSGPPSPGSLSPMGGLLPLTSSLPLFMPQSASPKLAPLLVLTTPITSSPSPAIEVRLKVPERDQENATWVDKENEMPNSATGKPLWSIRAGDAPTLGLAASSLSISTSSAGVGTGGVSPRVRRGVLGDVATIFENGEREEEKKIEIKKEKGEVVKEDILKEEKDEDEEESSLPGSCPELLKPTSSSDTNIIIAPTITIAAPISTLLSTSIAAASSSIPPTSTTTLSSSTTLERPPPIIERRPIVRSPLDIALAMQLRPGLGAGADPAWMVRFLMAMFGWFAILVSGQGEF